MSTQQDDPAPQRSPSWLDAIAAPEPPSEAAIAAQAQTSSSESALLNEETSYLDQLQRLQLKDYEQDIQARKDYANKLFWLISAWLLAILAVLIAVGFGRVGSLPFKLSDAVLMALIGSTTATVIGLFIVVVNYLFPHRIQKPPGT